MSLVEGSEEVTPSPLRLRTALRRCRGMRRSPAVRFPADVIIVPQVELPQLLAVARHRMYSARPRVDDSGRGRQWDLADQPAADSTVDSASPHPEIASPRG